jgi:hypothetical protein
MSENKYNQSYIGGMQEVFESIYKNARNLINGGKLDKFKMLVYSGDAGLNLIYVNISTMYYRHVVRLLGK